MAKIAYLCTDLLFTSKIRETAQALGHTLAAARDPDTFVVAASTAALALVDVRRDDALTALTALRRSPATAAVPAVGFCDHERTDRIEAARVAGCSLVLTKGKFAAELKHLMSAPQDLVAKPAGSPT